MASESSGQERLAMKRAGLTYLDTCEDSGAPSAGRENPEAVQEGTERQAGEVKPLQIVEGEWPGARS